MATDKGKAVDRSPPAPAITPEALRVLLDAIQALTLGISTSIVFSYYTLTVLFQVHPPLLLLRTQRMLP